jgi:putative ABC transport system permease protein
MALDGVTEAGRTRLGVAEMAYSSDLAPIIDFGEESFLFVVQGIDPITFDRINKILPVPVDKNAFQRGEIALINGSHVIGPDQTISGILTPGSVLRLKSGTTEIPVIIGGTSVDTALLSNISVSLSAAPVKFILIVSNAFFEQIFVPSKGLMEPYCVRLDLNVAKGLDEQVLNAINDMVNPNEIKMVSRFEARKAMQDAETVMYVLGGGISAVLSFIGLFNFINIMSVGVLARRREMATMESVGMTKRQTRSMLRCEGLGYAIITIAGVLTLGQLITFGLFRLFKKIIPYAIFTYPLAPCAAVLAAIILICLVTAEIVHKSVSKLPLTERLREAE